MSLKVLSIFAKQKYPSASTEHSFTRQLHLCLFQPFLILYLVFIFHVISANLNTILFSLILFFATGMKQMNCIAVSHPLTWVVVNPVASASSRFSRGDGYGLCVYQSRNTDLDFSYAASRKCPQRVWPGGKVQPSQSVSQPANQQQQQQQQRTRRRAGVVVGRHVVV